MQHSKLNVKSIELLPQGGTYILVLKSTGTLSVEVGKLGVISLQAGFYYYVGSAFGPGGMRARLRRHCRVSKPVRWHIDYLSTAGSQALGGWCSYSARRLEHHWAAALATSEELQGVARFGCSDCRCATHLYYSKIDRLQVFSQLPLIDGFWRYSDSGS